MITAVYICMADIINTSKWYEYKWPLEPVAGAPVPSRANYDPKNIAPLVESFAAMFGVKKEQIQFTYENNDPNNVNTNIDISHPGDAVYLNKYLDGNKQKSSAQSRYELYAKQSARLIAFQNLSPAGVDYFND